MRNCKWKILIKLKKEKYISDLGVFSLSLTKLLLWLCVCVCVLCVFGWRRRGQRGGRGRGVVLKPNKSLKLSRFAWKALRPVICSLRSLLQQDSSACVWRSAQ